MIKGRWQSFLDSLKKGAVKFANRRLEDREIKKMESLVEEQKHIAQKLAKVFEDYDQKLQKIAGLFEQCRQGELERLMPYIQKLQQELHGALTRADLAISESSDLRREMADWQRRSDEGLEESIRYRCLMSELALRGDAPQAFRVSPVHHEIEKGVQIEDDEFQEPSAKVVEERHGAVYYTDSAGQYLENNADHLVLNIKELSRELARYQQSPEAEPTESLRLAQQIRDLHALLRKTDRKTGAKRDRIEATDGFRHVFSSH